MSAQLTPAEAGETARAKAILQGLSVERQDKRAKEAEDMAWIGIIATRADQYIKLRPSEFDPTAWERTNSVIMLIQVKARNPKLNLKRFAEFDDDKFVHDFFGLAACAKAPTGELLKGFLPKAMRGEP